MKTTLDHATRTAEPDRPAFAIETLEDYELATQRVAALQACRKAQDKRERDALMQAIASWDASHDDATRWKD